MPRPTLNTKTDQLRQLASARDTKAFVTELLDLLQRDFSRWFSELKTQKLLSHFRSKSHIETVRALVFALRRTDPHFAKEESEALAHHLDVCAFFQDLFDYIDAETAGLSCRIAHPEVFLRTVVRVLEISNYGFQKNVTATVISEGGATSLETAQYARRIRDLLDAGNVILCSKIARGGHDRHFTISDAEINKLVELAYLYDEVRALFDAYTYRDVTCRLNRRSLILKNTSREADLAAAVAAERTANADEVRFVLLNMMEVNVERECRNVPVDSSVSFFDFLTALDQAAQDEARIYLHAFKTDLEYELARFFDLSSIVKTNAGTFSVKELIIAWAFIFAVAMLGQRWSERLASVQQKDDGRKTLVDVPTPELKRNWVVRLLAREGGVSRQQSRALVQQFSSEIAVGRTDLFYKPLIPISDAVLFPTAYIRSSRFDRNVFMLIATESDLDQKKKGYVAVRNLCKEFHKAGFYAVTDCTIRVNHQDITDLDVAAFKDGFLFLGQSKIVIEPDGLYDGWKAEQKLSRAAAQLDKCLEHLDVIRDGLFEQLGIKGFREHRVVPFIVTNSRQFTERRFGGYPVVDLPYLRFVLSGARSAVVGTGSGRLGTAPGKTYIKGRYPTPEEFEELLKRTIHKAMEREMVERYEMKKVGDRKLHIPMVGLKTPGEGQMVITDREIFEKTSEELQRIATADNKGVQ